MPEAHRCRFLYWPPVAAVESDAVREITGVGVQHAASASAGGGISAVVGSTSGHINSPRFPSSYPERTNCTYEFLAHVPTAAAISASATAVGGSSSANATRPEVGEHVSQRVNRSTAPAEAPLVVLFMFEQFQIDAPSET